MNESVVLTLDFPGRRDANRITDLGLDGRGFRSVELFRQPLPTEVDAHGYAQALLSRLDLAGSQVTGVLAYCGATPIAREIANLLPAPVVIAFNASSCTAMEIAEDYAGVLRQLHATSGTAVDVAGLLSDPAQLLDAMRTEMNTHAEALLTEDAFDEEELREARDDVVSVYVDLLTHLVAGHHSAVPVDSARLVNIVPTGRTSPVEWEGEEVLVDCEPDELLMHPQTLKHVLSRL